MERLFYSKVDKCVFLIPNYYTNGSSYLTELVKNLEKEADYLVSLGAERDKIITYEILNSRKYKNMWVFYYYTSEIPKEAYILNDNWTMDKWITN